MNNNNHCRFDDAVFYFHTVNNLHFNSIEHHIDDETFDENIMRIKF